MGKKNDDPREMVVPEEIEMKALRYIDGAAILRFDEEACIGCDMCATVCPHRIFIKYLRLLMFGGGCAQKRTFFCSEKTEDAWTDQRGLTPVTRPDCTRDRRLLSAMKACGRCLQFAEIILFR